MGKGKSSRKRTDLERQPSIQAPEPVRQTQEPVDLVVATPAPPALSRLIQGLRTALGAMLDIADAAADTITRQLQRRA